MRFFFAALCCVALWMPAPGTAQGQPEIRVAVLKYGTANWELDLIHRRGLDREHGFRLTLLQRVSPNASSVALQGGAADFTVSDWLWAARQRDRGRDFRYFPYSTAVGELLVPPDSDARELADLSGGILGVAGGAEDKSWLLLQTYARDRLQFDLGAAAKIRYAAPPLLSGLVASGRLDALLTYWHYAARLRAEGYRTLVTMPEVFETLGVSGPVPMLGWVFPGEYADRHPARVNAFLAASYAAKQLLLTSDEAWEEIRPLMQADSDGVFRELRRAYRAGVPQRFTAMEIDAVNRVAELVAASMPGRRSGAAALPADIFWRGFKLGSGP